LPNAGNQRRRATIQRQFMTPSNGGRAAENDDDTLPESPEGGLAEIGCARLVDDAAAYLRAGREERPSQVWRGLVALWQQSASPAGDNVRRQLRMQARRMMRVRHEIHKDTPVHPEYSVLVSSKRLTV
jgi:hypothetical protein